MQDKIFWNQDGYIEVILVGDQTAQRFKSMYSEFLPLQEELKAEGRPTYALFDCSKETGFSLSSNKAALEILEKIQYDRIAMFSVPHANVTEGIIMAIGKSETTKLFDTREEALAWLLAE